MYREPQEPRLTCLFITTFGGQLMKTGPEPHAGQSRLTAVPIAAQGPVCGVLDRSSCVGHLGTWAWTELVVGEEI